MSGKTLAHGELRYVISSLLEENPRYGPEIMKALGDLSSGSYSPNSGSIFPTLKFLEEGGFAQSTSDREKQLFKITKAGRDLLVENEGFVTALLKRFSQTGETADSLGDRGKTEPEVTIHKAMRNLKSELTTLVNAGREMQHSVGSIIEKATAEIRKLKG